LFSLGVVLTMPKFKSSLPPITRKEIDDCIRLLHHDYHIGYRLFIHHSKWDLVKWFCLSNTSGGDLKNLYNVFKHKHFGVYVNDRRTIHIYTFNYGDPYCDNKVEITATVFHELRHFYQRTRRRKKYIHSFRGNEDCGYLDSLVERDANNFAARMTNKHMKEISKILNVYPNWISHFNSYNAE